MATGPGKTSAALQMMWRLWKAKRTKRALFLADRNIRASEDSAWREVLDDHGGAIHLSHTEREVARPRACSIGGAGALSFRP
jgi:hypothetical protein